MYFPKSIDNLEVRTAGNDVVVHDPAHGKVHVLNGTAAYVLQACDGKTSVDDIVTVLCDATGADRSLVSQDVQKILQGFASLNLIGT